MADIKFKNNPELENPILEKTVEKESELKELLVNYVGEKYNPEDGNITVDLIVATMVNEFPEFMEAVAVENWIRGYHQALHDGGAQGRMGARGKSPEQGGEVQVVEFGQCRFHLERPRAISSGRDSTPKGVPHISQRSASSQPLAATRLTHHEQKRW